jgi:uncharacterized YigZ family protein
MSSKRIIPAEEIKSEFQVSNSKFISTASPAFSVEEAKLFIDRIKSTYNDATHNVPIYIIGHPPSTIEHSNDDGEPSGTAGRPALSVLRGSGLGDIAIVITRYFGGTKLGTGGLVRAYSDAVREVIKILPKAQKVPTVTAQFSVPYNIYELVQRLVSKYEGSISDQIFDVQATLTTQFIQDKFPEFSQKLYDISNGQISTEIIDSNPNTIIPL